MIPLRKLLEAGSDIIASGIRPDLHDQQRHFWIDGANVEFLEEGVRKMRGWSAAFTPTGSAPVRGIGQMIATTQELIWGDQTKLYK